MQFEHLNKHHDRQSFDCGNVQINSYLHRLAGQHHKKGISKVHVLAQGSEIIGFYTLSNLMINIKSKHYPNTVPAILIGRIGVSLNHQGQGFSKMLLTHALQKITKLSQDTGIVFVVVDAKDEKLAEYYTKFGFVRTEYPLRLILEVSTLHKTTPD
ncbi:GNAT family N-acetyltransferase [Moraxella sp. FZFQ2102]|uniref:GNAT family N-acetyltransferase n=1 Tax=Moraxella sp. FZFQ2102 TaxID=2953752 RepID=UPI00209C5938|nr:GNAT family N-acetyltransferase [Moraxella sp. FZFQ2102]USZ14103.1 GNAT family N-acetyltransferase [Moraxella sp. FZFQ2102]